MYVNNNSNSNSNNNNNNRLVPHCWSWHWTSRWMKVRWMMLSWNSIRYKGLGSTCPPGNLSHLFSNGDSNR